MLRVVIIDDNAQDRFLVERELQRVFDELECLHIINEQQFLEALEADGFNLVITDYQFNWSDGLALLHRVKERYPDVPVVMFTGSGNEEVAVDAMKAGLDDYVIKSPQHYLRLVLAVRTALEKADIRRRAVRAEAQREELFEREQAARAEAERLLREAQEAEQRKDEFLAMLAHELRNPLTPIVNALHLLAQPELQTQVAEQMRDMMQRQVHHLSRLVDDLLDVSRITRGKIDLRRERLDLAALVRATAEDHRGLLQGADLNLEIETADGPAWVAGDATRLAQVLSNLLQNAAKFTDSGGRVRVLLRLDSRLGVAEVRVEDTGIGIEAELLPRVFDVFTQADHSMDRAKGGLGLGLALVRGLVELHGGQATAASAGRDRGAVFSFTLPLETPAETLQHEARAAVSSPALSVLIIEDSRDAADSLRMLLEHKGHRAETAYSGPSGIEAANRLRPDVILCDLGLPGGMNGYDVARTLRHDGRTSNIRLVAVSGYGQPEDRERALASGFDLHLTKPVMPHDLEKVLAGMK